MTLVNKILIKKLINKCIIYIIKWIKLILLILLKKNTLHYIILLLKYILCFCVAFYLFCHFNYFSFRGHYNKQASDVRREGGEAQTDPSLSRVLSYRSFKNLWLLSSAVPQRFSNGCDLVFCSGARCYFCRRDKVF